MAAAAASPYPTSKKVDVTDVLHGQPVADPYRWLEEPDAPEVQAWVDSQNTYFQKTYMEGAEGDGGGGGGGGGGPAVRASIRAAHEKRYRYGRVGCPMVRGGRVFVFRNAGLQNQDVLFDITRGVSPTPSASSGPSSGPSSGLDDEALFSPEVARPLLDLNAQFPEGTVALSSSAFSEDGSLYAYALSRGGSDWVTIRVRDVATGADLEDSVPWCKFTGITWMKGRSSPSTPAAAARGFFYCRYPAPAQIDDAEGGKAGTETGANRFAMVCYHALGTPASEDVLVYANPHRPNWRYGVEISEDGEYLILSTVKGTDPVNRLYYAHLPTVWEGFRSAAAADPASRVSVACPPGASPPPQPSSLPASDGSAAVAAAGRYLPFVRAFDSFDAEYDYIANDGPRFYFKTNLGAPRYRIVAADLAPGAPADPFVCAGMAEPKEGEAVDIDAPRGSSLAIADVVAQHAADVLDWAGVVAGRHLVTCYLRDVCNALTLRLLPSAAATRPMPAGATPAGDASVDALVLPGAAVDVPLPAPGTIGGWSGRRKHNTAFLKFVSFLHPGSTLQLTFEGPGTVSEHCAVESVSAPVTAAAAAGAAAGSARPVPLPVEPVPAAESPESSAEAPAGGATRCATITPYWNASVPDFDASKFEASQVFVPSKDGKVKIPLFIVRKREEGPVVPKPSLLYFYGGFSISMSPSYSSLRLSWLEECGGVWALANIRGGGEYGEAWHEGGSKHEKTNCFDDAASCAEWLVANGYTTPRKLGIMGGSNGGLGVLATAQRYPSLFGAVVSQVPVTDMLRFHKFTIGSAWRGEYGFAEDSEEDFRYMMGYSPLHNARAPASPEEEFPSTLITTADHDDRVVPLHSHKMTATLQAVVGSSPHQRRPLMTRVETQAGHGAGKPTAKVLDEYADVYAFLARELGATVSAPSGVAGGAQ